MEPTIQEQRSSDRVVPHHATVKISGLDSAPVTAIVLDESFGGIGVAAPVRIEPGTEIEVELSIEMGGIRSLALVRHAKPLPSGCRLGLEWKARSLSRHIRDLLSADEENLRNNRLLRILPGGITVMWRLFEAERWLHLIVAADRLRQEAAACQCPELRPAIDAFQKQVNEAMDLNDDEQITATVRRAMDVMIRECVRSTSASANQDIRNYDL